LRSAYHAVDLAAYQRLWKMHDNNRVYGHMSAEGNRMIADLIAHQFFAEKVGQPLSAEIRLDK
jgi:hypothetical protein